MQLKKMICPPDNENLTLKIPENIYKVPGLISEGLQACPMAGAPRILQYNLPVVFSLVSRAIANKLSINRVYPSLYNIKVGGTSTGKTDSDKVFKAAIDRCGAENFYGPTDFSSGPGLLRGMQETPQCYIAMDEVTNLFKRSAEDVIGAGKMAALMEIYTCTGDEIRKTYGDKTKSILIKNPCLIFTGNATLAIFDDIKMEDLLSGTLQRFDFWCYDGPIPYRHPIEYDNPPMDKFITKLSNLIAVAPPRANRLNTRRSHQTNYNLGMTDSAVELLADYSKYIIDSANSYKGEDGIQGMISRKYNLCQKYLMIHIASTRVGEEIFNLAEVEDLQWGIDVAEMLVDWKISKIPKRVTAGAFHRDCEIFKEAIIAAIRIKKKPTIRALCSRRKRLKELRPKERQDIVSNLLAQDEIVVDETTSPPSYWLKKE